MEGESIPPWMTETLHATAVVISGALNVLGLRRVIITGTLTELPPAVMADLSQAIVKGAMWARFGAVKVEAAPRRRTAGLVAVGIDRLVLPMEKHFRNDEGAPTASMSHKTPGGWLSYNE